MPLNGYLQSRDGGHAAFDRPERSGTEQRERSQQRQSNTSRKQRVKSPDDTVRVNSRTAALALKVEIPEALPKKAPKQTHSAAHPSPPRAASKVRPPKQQQPPPSAFDDTQSFNYDDDTGIGDHYTGQKGLAFHEGHNQLPPVLTDVQNHEQGYRNFRLLSEWPYVSDQERKVQGDQLRDLDALGHGTTKHDYTDTEYDIDMIEDEEGKYLNVDNDNPNWDTTPSKAGAAPGVHALSRPKKDAGQKQVAPVLTADPPMPVHKKKAIEHDAMLVHEAPPPQNTNRFKVHKAAGTRKTASLSVEAPQPRQLPVTERFSSKVSSYHESSSEEEQSPSAVPLARRYPEELDYDLETLKEMSFNDLDKVPFSTDPRVTPAEPAVDAHGNPVSLSQRLHNLTRMRQDDQRNMFKSQTDAEREETGDWFIEKFTNDMKALMRSRLERRKIALKYEMEVKRRQKAVLIKTAEVDDQLRNLKKGGDELIEGRNAGGVSTPKKA